MKQLFVLQTSPESQRLLRMARPRDNSSRAPSPASHTGTRLWEAAEAPRHPWGDGAGPGDGRARGRRGHEQPGTLGSIHPGRGKVVVELCLLFLEARSKQRHSLGLGCAMLHFQFPCRHHLPESNVTLWPWAWRTRCPFREVLCQPWQCQGLNLCRCLEIGCHC